MLRIHGLAAASSARADRGALPWSSPNTYDAFHEVDTSLAFDLLRTAGCFRKQQWHPGTQESGFSDSSITACCLAKKARCPLISSDDGGLPMEVRALCVEKDGCHSKDGWHSFDGCAWQKFLCHASTAHHFAFSWSAGSLVLQGWHADDLSGSKHYLMSIPGAVNFFWIARWSNTYASGHRIPPWHRFPWAWGQRCHCQLIFVRDCSDNRITIAEQDTNSRDVTIASRQRINFIIQQFFLIRYMK